MFTQTGTSLTATSPHLPGVTLHGTLAGTSPGGAQQFDVTVSNSSPGSCPVAMTGSVLITSAGELTGSTSGTNTDCVEETDALTLQKGSTLVVAGVDVDGLTVDNVVVSLDGGALTRLDDVVFRNFPASVLQLRVTHPGAPAPFTFNHLTFQTTPATGFYLLATDTAADANVLTINLQDPTATDGPAHTLTQNGAVVHWLTNRADLAVQQTDAPDPAVVNGSVTYLATVTNAGPSTAQSVTLSDSLPNSATLQSATPSQGTCGPGPSGFVICALGDLAPGAAATVTVTVHPFNSETLINHVDVSSSVTPDPNVANNSWNELTTVLPLTADVSISVSHVPAQPVVGEPLTYAITATNGGPSTATTVVVTDTLPSGVTFVSVSDDNCSVYGTQVTCQAGSLAPGEFRTFTVVVTPHAAQPITNTATVSASPVGSGAGEQHGDRRRHGAGLRPLREPDVLGSVSVRRWTAGCLHRGGGRLQR